MIEPQAIDLRADSDGFVYYRGAPLTLPPKEQAVLHLLVSHWPKAVEKSRFADVAWGGRGMSDESLARCVAALRRTLSVLGDIRIQAVYRFGYQLQLGSGAGRSGGRSDGRRPRHRRLQDASTGAPPLAESVIFASQLVNQRKVSSLQLAERTLRAVLARDGSFMAARLVLGSCLAAQLNVGIGAGRKLLDEASTLLSVVERDAPDTPGLHSLRGHLLDCGWRFGEARRWHDQALADDDEDSSTLYHYGWHLMATGAVLDAATVLGRATDQHPFSEGLAIFRTRALTALCRIEEALAVVEQLCLKYPESPVPQLNRLALQASIAPRPEHLQAARMFTLEPADWPLSVATLAYIHARCGDRDGALRVLAVQAHAGPLLRVTHAPALVALDRIDEAIAVIEQAAPLGCGALPIMLRLPQLAALKDHPRLVAATAALYRGGSDS
ncbi:MAG: winged helix-turn-helix domain-containing protein [Burkholderiaceae bacterium]